jgi:4-hydroxy-4-methyl-2-oxoglutarate aldolase
MSGTNNATDVLLARAGKLETATLSDAMDRLGIAGQCLGIKPLDHRFRLLGRAYTLSYAPVGHPAGSVGDFIDDVPEGRVIVIDNGGRADATVWGDILTLCAHRRGIGGTVIDGACRDTHLALDLNYPIFSRSYSMRTGKDRVQLESVEATVTIGDARVVPGDIVRGDSDGVLVIPNAVAVSVLDVAEGIDAAEGRIREAIIGGARLDDARKQQQYHLLQRRET